MLICIAFSPKDFDQTVRLADWLNELGPYPNHEMFILRDARCEPIPKLGESFGKKYENLAKAVVDGWPEGGNYMFRTCTSIVSYQKNVKYFLWLEPDAIPLKPGWLDAIEAEYLKSGKPFMGDDVNVNDVPRHMSGIGVYPNPIFMLAGEAYRAADVAWDVAAKDQIVPNAHFTQLIEHAWRHETFTDPHELDTQIDKEAVLFHSSKDGSLIKLLRQHYFQPVLTDTRQQKGGDASCRLTSGSAAPTVRSAGAATFQSQERPEIAGAPTSPILADIWATRMDDPPSGWPALNQTTYDIFIRTYPADYPWLEYCLKSIRKYATGFRKIWIVSPQAIPVVALGVEWKVMNEESEDGYLSQQIHKLYADVITNYQADYILHIDSDTLFTRPTTPKDFFRNDKLIWYYTPYEHTDTPWKAITEKFMGKPVTNEFMRRLPMIMPRWLYPKLREYCHRVHGDIISNYVKNQPNREFSEFNALGAFAYEKFHDKFEWINTQEVEMPLPFARQFWSRAGITDAVKKEIDQILSGGVEGHASSSKVTTAPNVDVATETGGNRGQGGGQISSEIPNDQRSGSTEVLSVSANSSIGNQAPTTQKIGVPLAESGNREEPAVSSEVGLYDRHSSASVPSNGDTPAVHIAWLANYADNPSKRQYVINAFKKKVKSVRKKKLAKA